MNNNEEIKYVKTGTTTIGIVCKDGIVLAADKRATAGYLVSDKKADKIHKINDRIAVTMAGTVSDAQLLIRVVRAEAKLKEIKTYQEIKVEEAANLLARLVYSNIRKYSTIPGIAHFIMGGVDKEGFQLYDIYPDGSILKYDDYLSSGSGSTFALGVLETLYKKNMSVKDGVQLAVKAINAALQRDIATGNGIDIFTITKKGVEKVFNQSIENKIKN